MVHLNFKLVLYELFKQKYVNFLHLSKNDNSSLFPFSAHSKYLSTNGFFVSSGPVLLLILIILTDLIKEILPCYHSTWYSPYIPVVTLLVLVFDKNCVYPQ